MKAGSAVALRDEAVMKIMILINIVLYARGVGRAERRGKGRIKDLSFVIGAGRDVK